MNFYLLREYVEFSKHLNFSAAARYLHISQSGLSKHIAEMERELGFELVDREGTPTLTAAGKLFLASAQDLLYRYDIAVEECHSLHGEKPQRLIVHDPLIDATIGDQAIPAFVYLSEHNPNVTIELHTIKGQTIKEALVDGVVDIGYLMAYGDVDEVIQKRERQGFYTVPIKRRGFSAFMSIRSPLAQLDELHVEDLEQTPFLIAADRLFDDWRDLLDQMGRTHGFAPRIKLKVTPTINGFLAMNLSDGVVLLSDAFLADPRFLMRKDMVSKRIADESYVLYYTYLMSNKNPALPLFIEQLNKQIDDEFRPYVD